MNKSIIDRLMLEQQEGVISGAVVAWGNAGREQECLATGYADLQQKMPMRQDSIFDIASITKVLATVSSLLICRQDGLIDFDAPFTEYLDFHALLPGRPPTIREMANHLSGFSHEGHEIRQYSSENGVEINNNLLCFPPLFVPGVHYEYACWNYMLLARIVERLTEMPFSAFCRKRIFAPLSMNETALGQPQSFLSADRLTQSIGTSRGGIIADRWARRLMRDGYVAGHAGVFTSAGDMGKFCRMLLNGGGDVFTAGSIAQLTTVQPTTAHPVSADRTCSFGWIMQDPYKPKNASAKTIFHSGYTGHTILIDFDRNLYGIVFTTRNDFYERAKVERFKILETLIADAEK